MDAGGNAAHSGGDHGANHGGNHGGDHLHAHPPEGDHYGSWGKKLFTGMLTIFLGLVLVGIGGWFVSRLLAISRLEEEITHLKEASQEKAGKGEVINLREKLDTKAEKGDVTHLREKLDTKADALPVQNQLDTDLAEIEKLRLLVSNYNASYNNSAAIIQKHENEVVALRAKASSLLERVAKMEVQTANGCADLKQLKDVKLERIAAEIATLREKIASIESSMKNLESKK